jgi:phenylacetate-CoA oxygenase, PaaH subunit
MTNEWPLWEVFIRGQSGLNHRHVGSLHAPDSNMAIRNARDVYTRRNEGVSIWVVEANGSPPPPPRTRARSTSPQRAMSTAHPTFYDILDQAGQM